MGFSLTSSGEGPERLGAPEAGIPAQEPQVDRDLPQMTLGHPYTSALKWLKGSVYKWFDSFTFIYP